MCRDLRDQPIRTVIDSYPRQCESDPAAAVTWAAAEEPGRGVASTPATPFCSEIDAPPTGCVVEWFQTRDEALATIERVLEDEPGSVDQLGVLWVAV